MPGANNLEALSAATPVRAADRAESASAAARPPVSGPPTRPREPFLARLWRIRFQAFVIVASMLVAEGGHWSGVLTPIEHLYSDLWHRISGVRFTPEHVALVVVDDQSLADHGDVPMVFWTPLFARAAATLREAGATVIGVDFLFGFTPEDWISKLNLSTADALRDYDLPFRQELNRGRMVLVGAVVRGTAGAPDGVLLAHPDYLLSLPSTDFATHVGFADLNTDSDGGVRNYEVTPAVKLPPDLAEGAPRLGLAALLAARAAGLDKTAALWNVGGRSVATDQVGTITYAGPSGTVPRVSMSRVLADGALNDPSVQALRGKVVIIGGDYQGMNDVHTTPYSGRLLTGGDGLMAGVEIQANIVETLLSGRETREAPAWLRYLTLFVFIGFTTYAYRRRSPWTGLAELGVGLAVTLIIGFAAFQRFWLVPAASLQLGLMSAYLLAFSERLTSEERDKARVKTMFKGYVSDSVVDMLLSSERRLDLEGQSMHITVLFSDIRQFTTISEKLTPRETVEFLNAYYSSVVAVILEEGGRIDKFIGDAVMAEFGVPYNFPDHAHRALSAAVKIRAVAKEFQEWMRTRFPDRDIPEFHVGVGIHTGDAVVGNVGSETRMEYTAVGDTVNVASRLEGETKYLNCVIAASVQTVREAGGRVQTGIHETVRVKGRLEPVEVYEIIDVIE
ncbi:MAG TPA: adenylate/guanylate cyclase domain-containing protein [Vicinamibacterales bacterium]|nr:adenylate/guanylate cyclase domain-containing protein [Vicinamibacterales bacterium]